jgi:hypothetical protein
MFLAILVFSILDFFNLFMFLVWNLGSLPLGLVWTP